MDKQESAKLSANMHSMLADKLKQINSQIGISEVHGVLCGLACQGIDEKTIADYANLVQLQDADSKLIIEGLYSLILRDLNADDSRFKVLLPDEDGISLNERIESTADWANGFIQGLLHQNETIIQSSETIQECIDDMLKISQMDGAVGDIENDMKAINQTNAQLTEIEEHLRVNVQLMFLEIQKSNPNTTATNTTTH